MTICSFPTEVEEAVIDQCADDVGTLRHCALTCRRWLPRSRFHLFSAVCVSTPDRLWSFCDVLDAHPELRCLIESVTMAPGRSVKHPSCLLETFPIRLLSRAPNLRRWALRSSFSTDRMRSVSFHSATLRQLRISSSLLNLTLEHLSFTSIAEILRFVCSFRSLRYMRCTRIRFNRRNTLTPD